MEILLNLLLLTGLGLVAYYYNQNGKAGSALGMAIAFIAIRVVLGIATQYEPTKPQALTPSQCLDRGLDWDSITNTCKS